MTTGEGRDLVAGAVRIQAADDADVSQVAAFDASPSFAMSVDTGPGADRVTAKVDVSVGDDGWVTDVEGFSDADITTGGGDDVVYGSVRIAGGDGTDINQSATIRSDIDTGSGDDRIVARMHLATGEEGVASTSAAIRLAGADEEETYSIAMGHGDDVLIARAEIDAPESQLAFAVGIIFGDVDMGAGDDQVIAIGASTGTGDASPALNGSFGIAEATVRLGDGDDYLKARGADGGIRLAHLDGGKGDDVFDVKDGTGSIDGGEGEDLLRLGGRMSDYTFSSLDGERMSRADSLLGEGVLHRLRGAGGFFRGFAGCRWRWFHACC